MSNSLQDLVTVNLVSLLPESIAADDQVTSAATAIQDQIQAVVSDVQAALPLMPNLNNLPERIIDLLAWQYHLDYYDTNASISRKRQRVRSAIEEHRLAGTRAGLSLALNAVFGQNNYTIVEWWEMDPPGDPYTFYVLIKVPFTREDFDRAQAMVTTSGNVRSHWVGYITWSQLDALTHTWNALDALSLKWDEFELYYLYAPV